MWTEKNMIGRKTEEQKDTPGVLHAVEPVPAGVLQINTENMTKEELERIKVLFEGAIKEADRHVEVAPGIPEPSVKEYGTVEEAVNAIKEEMQKEGVDYITVLSVEAEEKVAEEKTVSTIPDGAVAIPYIKPAEKAEEPEVVPIDLPEEEEPAVAQETAPVEMPADEAEPTPCPFCGAEIKLTYYKRWHVTGHEPSCILAPNYNVGKTKDQIIEAWNRRR